MPDGDRPTGGVLLVAGVLLTAVVTLGLWAQGLAHDAEAMVAIGVIVGFGWAWLIWRNHRE